MKQNRVVAWVTVPRVVKGATMAVSETAQAGASKLEATPQEAEPAVQQLIVALG